MRNRVDFVFWGLCGLVIACSVVQLIAIAIKTREPPPINWDLVHAIEDREHRAQLAMCDAAWRWGPPPEALCFYVRRGQTFTSSGALRGPPP